MVRIEGDSMEPVLQKGDMVVVDPERAVTDGDLALIYAGDEMTVREVFIQENMLILLPFNYHYRVVVVPQEDGEVAAIGRIVRMIRDFD